MTDTQTTKNITKKLLAFTAPLMLSGLFQQLFNWADAFIVGNVEGELALAGIGATTSLYNLFVTVITGFTSGLAVLTAQSYGKGKKESIRELLSTCSLLFGICFFLISAAGVFQSENILLLLDTPKQLLSDVHEYLRILFIGIPFLAVYNTYSAVLRGIGNSRPPSMRSWSPPLPMWLWTCCLWLSSAMGLPEPPPRRRSPRPL